MVSKHHGVMGPQVSDQTLALFQINGRSLKIMVAQVTHEAHRRLGHGQQTTNHARDRHTRSGVGVDHAIDIVASLVDGAVDHIPRLVDAVIGVWFVEDVAVDVDFDKTRSGDFFVQEAVQIDEQVIGAWNFQGDVVVDQVRHAVQIHETVTSSKLHSGQPLLMADHGLKRFELGVELG